MNEQLPDAAGITTGLTELAAMLLRVEDVEVALRHLARMAVVVIPDGPSCGITVVRDGKFTTVVYSGSVPASVHEAQYELGDGPGLAAMRERAPVVVQDLAAEPRWDGFPAAALKAGAHGVYAHPLQIGDEVVGALCLYAHERNLFPEPVQRVAIQFVEPAAVLLGGVLRRVSQAELIEQMRLGMASRAVIDQAIGIIMAQRRCGPEEALNVLRKISNNRNIKLRDVAAELVRSIAGRDPLRPPR
ncbi:MAG: GAF and ANTAR domain-containing protein [Candidatus Dormibacteraeota bacterium]|nr:GAF and ANTAR domain-containing protein [Candidatus Dormibacteraeota bacterium]